MIRGSYRVQQYMNPKRKLAFLKLIFGHIGLLRYPNVLILTTSNIVGSIDLAFVDRADLKIFIDHPPSTVIYGILSSCINELLRVTF